jgi:hypothetical protein
VFVQTFSEVQGSGLAAQTGQSAVDCNGCAKMPQTQRAEMRFCRQPSQLDLTNAQYDGVENRSVTGHYNLP